MSAPLFKIEIEGKQYNCARMSADKQFEISHLLGQYGLLLMAKDKSFVPAIISQMMRIPLHDAKRIADSLLEKSFVNGTDRHVTVNTFDGDIFNYWRLVAELVVENFQKFSSYLLEEMPKMKAKVDSVRAEMSQ